MFMSTFIVIDFSKNKINLLNFLPFFGCIHKKPMKMAFLCIKCLVDNKMLYTKINVVLSFLFSTCSYTCICMHILILICVYLFITPKGTKYLAVLRVFCPFCFVNQCAYFSNRSQQRFATICGHIQHISINAVYFFECISCLCDASAVLFAKFLFILIFYQFSSLCCFISILC